MSEEAAPAFAFLVGNGIERRVPVRHTDESSAGEVALLDVLRARRAMAARNTFRSPERGGIDSPRAEAEWASHLTKTPCRKAALEARPGVTHTGASGSSLEKSSAAAHNSGCFHSWYTRVEE